jgi:hypothetical protein
MANNEKDTNTGHGHVWARPDGLMAKCGGPGLCKECSLDAQKVAEQPVAAGLPERIRPEDGPHYSVNKASEYGFLAGYNACHEAFTAWLSKTAQALPERADYRIGTHDKQTGWNEYRDAVEPLFTQVQARVAELESRDPRNWSDRQILDFLGIAFRNVDVVGEIHLREIRQGFQHMAGEEITTDGLPRTGLAQQVSQ